MKNDRTRFALIAPIACAAILGLLAACSTGSGPETTAASETPATQETPAAPKATVYASGYYYDADWNELPCYWRDGSRTPLSVMGGTTTGAAKAITASNGTIHIAGYSDSAHPVACYWAGGTRFDQDHFSEGAAGICVDGGTVYTIVNNPYLSGPSGGSTNSGMYYANQTRAENLFGEGTYVKGISAINGSICAVGQNADSRASYWYDAPGGIIETVLFSGASDACSVNPSGNYNYIAGSVGGAWSEKPCYWAITMGILRTDLDIGSSYGEAVAIKVVDDVVYTAGWYNDGSGSGDIPCFWEGTERIALPKASYDSQATGIDVLDGIVYVSGWYSAYDAVIDGLKMNPCYWTVVDGVPTRTDLPGGYNDGRATGIVVVME